MIAECVDPEEHHRVTTSSQDHSINDDRFWKLSVLYDIGNDREEGYEGQKEKVEPSEGWEHLKELMNRNIKGKIVFHMNEAQTVS